MSRRKSPVLAALFKLTRAGVRQSARIGRAATRQGVEAGGKLAEQAGRVLSAVATPTDAPGAVAGGRWYEGRWGLGPLALRRWRLFVPVGATARKPLPLLVLLHGCAQDCAAFAAVTRAAVVARAHGFAVLLPEQGQDANPQRCWNWFGSEARVGLETQTLIALIDHVVQTPPRVGGPLFALGLSAGGAMALTLALRHPERFCAVGSHSGAAPASARTPLLAGPGAIVAAMVAVESAATPVVGWVSITAAIIVTHVVIWLTLRFSVILHRVLGDSAIRVLTRIFGLLLAAIAVQMMADGVFSYIDIEF